MQRRWKQMSFFSLFQCREHHRRKGEKQGAINAEVLLNEKEMINNQGNDFSRIKKHRYLLHIPGHGVNKKRTFFSALSARASLTVEAALILPLFLFFIIGMSSFLMILCLQMDIQCGMEDLARNLGRKAYMIYRTDLESEALGPAAVSIGIHTGALQKRLERASIEGGAAGVNALFSTYDPESGILDEVVSYVYRIPLLPDKASHLLLGQRVRTHVWIGRELDSCGEGGEEKGTEENEEQNRQVYVTEHGTVYHTSKDCRYLDLSIRAAEGESIEGLRNKDGSKYGGCPFCAGKGKPEGLVYITDYGNHWHTDLGCSGLKRTVEEKKLSEIGDLPLCSKCGKQH